MDDTIDDACDDACDEEAEQAERAGGAEEAAGCLVVLCTAPSMEVAVALARGAVEAGLAACVNLIPGVRSFYRWDGAIQDDAESQLILKIRADRLDALTRWIIAAHPYETPEVIALPITGGSAAYLDWLRSS